MPLGTGCQTRSRKGASTWVSVSEKSTSSPEDAEFKKKRHEKEGREGPFPEIPLYTIDDVNASMPLFLPVNTERPS